MIGKVRRFAAVGAVALALLGVTATAAHAASTHAAVAAAAHPAVGYSVQGWTRASSGLSVRSGPGAGFPALGSLPYNTQVTVYFYEAGSNVSGDPYWDVIIYGNQYGFISDYWTYTGGDITGQVADFDFTTGVAKDPGGLTVYSGAGTGSVRGSIPDNAFVPEVECRAAGPSVGGDTYWDYVVYGSASGYVADYWLYTGTDITTQVPLC